MKEFVTRHISGSEENFRASFDFPPLRQPASEQVKKTNTVLSRIDTTLTLDQQFSEVDKLQKRWDGAIGNKTSEETKLASNYNPVLARWNYERMETDMQKKSFREAELKNIETALRERNQTAESRLTFTFDTNGKVRNEMFPDEPYENMLERGLSYREKHGSKETIREQAEVVGFKKMQDTFADSKTPIGTKYVMISPPSQMEESIYTHNFVDMYELRRDEETGEKVIGYTRFASSLDYDQYEDVSKKLDETYLIKKALKDEEIGCEQPMDAWYLGNPIKVDATAPYKNADDLFKQFELDDKAMEERQWRELWKLYVPFAMHLLDTLTKDTFDPVAIAKAYNTMLHSGENKELIKKMKETTVYDRDGTFDQKKVKAMVDQYGRKEVEEKKVGCGASGGVNIGGGSGGGGIFGNSVARFGAKPEEEEPQEWFSCPKCSYKADGPVGNSCPGCGLTKETYAKESGIECD